MPILAKLGDMFVLKRILLVCTVLTAGASWALVQSDSFTTFLIAWALQGFSVVGLPLEVALIFDRGRSMGLGASQTRRAAGFLVVALEAGAIIGALSGALLGALLGGRVFGWFGNSVPLTIPAIAVPLHLETRQVFLNIFIAGIGCGALVGAMPAVVAAGAPRGQTGIAAATSTASSLARLSHHVDHVRNRCLGGCRAALLRAEARVRGWCGRAAGKGGDRPHRVTGELYSFGASAPRITLCGAACATGLMVTRSRFTNPGSSIECTIASAMSSACNGFTTLS